MKIRTRNGLFSDFVTHTKNQISIHTNSAGVDWRVCYDVPEPGVELTLRELFSRIPDLQSDFRNIAHSLKYALVHKMEYSHDTGFRAKVHKDQFDCLGSYYESAGYSLVDQADRIVLTADAETFRKNRPLFIHSYLHKTLGLIPALDVSEPFEGEARYSQLCITYMVSYVLGMLVRYYPTHWVSLTQGDKGDEWWPTVNHAQQFVEQSFPELVIELIGDIVEKEKDNRIQ